MSLQLYIYPELTTGELILSEEESHHIVRVMRLVKGDVILLTDGKGNIAEARITDANAKSGRVEVNRLEPGRDRRSYELHMAVAPTKNIDRFEWFLEKATEIGIDSIIPLITSRSERRKINEERLEKVIVAAVKQSVRTYVPMLKPVTFFSDFVSMPLAGRKYIAHCHSDDLPPLKQVCNQNEIITILIGPEGDFTDDEVKAAEKNDFTAISLGRMRLRTETAALVACHSVAFINQ